MSERERETGRQKARDGSIRRERGLRRGGGGGEGDVQGVERPHVRRICRG